jgi:hypothetical protein
VTITNATTAGNCRRLACTLRPDTGIGLPYAARSVALPHKRDAMLKPALQDALVAQGLQKQEALQR